MATDIQRAQRVREVRPGVWEYSDGAIRDSNGRAVALPPQMKSHIITQANTSEFAARRRLVGLRAQLEGLAEANDVDPSEIDDELLLQAGSALRAITAHMARTFKGSKSLRGMAETYDKLAAPLVGDRREKQADDPGEQGNIYVIMAQLVSHYGQVTDIAISASKSDEVVDGTTADETEGNDDDHD